MWASGRHFGEALIERIQAAVDAGPGISRRALSRIVCEWMDWRSPAGELQEMSCRKALLDLHKHGAIRLPQASGSYGFQRPRNHAADEPICAAQISCTLADLGPVELALVPKGSRGDSRVWNRLMGAHHYLGAGPLCGAQIRYLVRSPVHGWLGALAFSSPTLRLYERDEWIGWSERARRANLGRVVLNSRFLIVPTVEVPNLASHVLARAVSQVAADWHSRYGHTPVLVETFVDPVRFHGGCYRAANWTLVGQSAGRQDAYANGKVTSGPKDIYVYPLDPAWKKLLCTEPARRLKVAAPARRPGEDWVGDELGRVDLADGRLRDRLQQVARDFFARPGALIPEACGGSVAKIAATYRLCRNPNMDMQTVLQPHVEATMARMEGHTVILAAQDTSDLNYTHHPATEGLGPLGSIDDLTVGLKLHSTMAFTTRGTPLGLLDVQCWARDGSTVGKSRKKRPIEEKESFKWIHSYRKVAEVQRLLPKTRLVSVADREGDLYELFAEALQDPLGPGLLVRAEKSRARKVDEEELLWEHMARLPVAAFQDLLIPRKGSRPARKTRLAVRFDAVELRPPEGRKGPALQVWAIYAHECDYDPHKIKEPLSWMLLTTVETPTAAAACERLSWYARRWGIEVYHRVLKSGCRIEDRRLGQAEGLAACLAIDMVVAWRIQWLTYHGRETPEMPCDAFLADDEWKAACVFLHRRPPPAHPPTIRDALRMIATLGGFMGRKGDKEPGTMTLWRGLRRLADIVESFAIARLMSGQGGLHSGP